MMIPMMENSHSTRSPPFRNFRQFAMTSGKRAHSPDGSPGDRPAKRLLLATGDVDIGYRHFSTSFINGSRYPSEDWVQQAGGLTINGPIFPLTANHSSLQVPDVEMSVDPDESGVLLPRTSSNLPPPVVPQHQHTQLPNILDFRYSGKMQPVFDVVSPTPIFTVPLSKNESAEQHPSTQPSTPIDSSPNAMVLSSPVTSFSPPSIKRRVFFGPRIGCEKCRLGVKGHFIHSE